MMLTEKGKTLIKVLYIVYIILLICFIFSNSMASKEESAGVSEGVLAFVNGVLESVGLPFAFEHSFVRKAAHVIEFMTLGASLFGFLILNKTVSRKNCIYCAFLSSLVAMSDETIQYFFERGSMLLDVWLDSFSAYVGILIVFVIYHFISLRKKIS